MGKLKDSWSFPALPNLRDPSIFIIKLTLLYIDGELEAEMPCKGKLLPNDESLYIGARGGSQRFLTGALDEIKMYNYALTKEELLKDMAEPVTLHVDARDKLATVWARLKTD